MHPSITLKITQNQTRPCPCGATPEYPHAMCRKCHASMVWRRRKAGPARHASRRRRGRQSRERRRILAFAESMSSASRREAGY